MADVAKKFQETVKSIDMFGSEANTPEQAAYIAREEAEIKRLHKNGSFSINRSLVPAYKHKSVI